MEAEQWHLLAKGDLSSEVWNFLQIASALEQKGQKELQNKHHGSVRAVMATYSRLFMSCRDEMYVVVLTLICWSNLSFKVESPLLFPPQSG
jgi:hypothetical protein